MPLTTVRAADWVVCELSSFQLEDVHAFACDVAVLLNLEPDHLDRYPSFEAYRDAKLRIFERARVKVVPRGSGLEGIEFAGDDPLPAEPLLRGAHNRENAAAAAAAARAAGIEDDAIAEALRTFPGVAAPARARRRGRRRALRERLEGDERRRGAQGAGGVRREPVHLILGGSLKGEDFAAARRRDRRERPLRPPDRPGERRARGRSGLPRVTRDETLERAVEHARELARAGDVVLLSPACASYDQFENFEQPRRASFGSGQAPTPVLGIGLPGEFDPGEAGRARVEVVDPRHAGAGRVRPRDGLLRDVRRRGGRRQRSELLPEAAGHLRGRSGSG